MKTSLKILLFVIYYDSNHKTILYEGYNCYNITKLLKFNISIIIQREK